MGYQIAQYPEKNVEALLRAHIQKMNNCLFIYAGSNRHILENMFNSAAKPFYNSAEQLYLDCIPKEIYTAFANEQFSQAASFFFDIFCRSQNNHYLCSGIVKIEVLYIFIL